MNNPSLLAGEFMETGRLALSIIDLHTHMGGFVGSYLPRPDCPDMIQTMDENNVSVIACAPNQALFDPTAGNDLIEEVMLQYPDKVRGYYCFNPNTHEAYEDIFHRVESHIGYVGFKILPDYHKRSLDDREYYPIYDYAQQNSLLLLTHTWGVAADGHSYSSMDNIRKVSKDFSSLNLLLGHSVQGQCDEAIELVSNTKSVYLELTDTYRINGLIEKMVQKVGSEKVLFGTDLPWYDPRYCLGCILFSHIDDAAKRNIIHHNGQRLIDTQRHL